MQPITPTECLDAIRLRIWFYQIADQYPEDSLPYQVALRDLRMHKEHCEQCKDYLRFYAGQQAPEPAGGE